MRAGLLGLFHQWPDVLAGPDGFAALLADQGHDSEAFRQPCGERSTNPIGQNAVRIVYAGT